MAEIPIDKKFAVLCEISRAQHFAWHEAVKQMCPGVDLAAVVNRMWELSGHDTARAYLKRLDKNKPLAPQVAASIVWSSQCMGEDAKLEESPRQDDSGKSLPRDEAFVRHGDCPWFHWHQRLGLLAEDRPGCDVWFKTIVDDVNQALGSKLQVATLSALPDGGDCCRRRFWVD